MSAEDRTPQTRRVLQVGPLMTALPKLGAIVNFGVGYDTTDVDAAAAHGVSVSNTPDVLTDVWQTPQSV